MKKCWMVLAVLLAGTVGAEDLVIQSFDADGTITFNAISNATAYAVEEEVDGVWSNLVSIPVNGSGTVTVTVSTVEQSMRYCVVASVTTSPVPVGMVLIPGGSNSGTNPLGPGESYSDCYYPATYSLSVGSFYMDRYEVTKAQWDEVANWGASSGYDISAAGGSGKGPDYPVHDVTWYECVKWCNARSEMEKRAPAYYTSAARTTVYRTGSLNVPVEWVRWDTGYRLPADEEWEYAARGGEVSKRFSWGGDTIQHDQANYSSDSYYSYDTSSTRGHHPSYNTGDYPYTSPVGVFAANTYGLYDMAGNVWEWCTDWHPCYAGSRRVIRGGSWNNDANYCRAGHRYYSFNASNSSYFLGFRAVLPSGQ